MNNQDKIINVSSGFGGNTRKPFVQIAMDYPKDHPLQISPEEARALAMNLLQAAEAADQDQFIFNFAKTIADDDRAAGNLLLEYRKFRNKESK